MYRFLLDTDLQKVRDEDSALDRNHSYFAVTIYLIYFIIMTWAWSSWPESDFRSYVWLLSWYYDGMSVIYLKISENKKNNIKYS